MKRKHENDVDTHLEAYHRIQGERQAAKERALMMQREPEYFGIVPGLGDVPVIWEPTETKANDWYRNDTHLTKRLSFGTFHSTFESQELREQEHEKYLRRKARAEKDVEVCRKQGTEPLEEDVRLAEEVDGYYQVCEMLEAMAQRSNAVDDWVRNEFGWGGG